MSFTHLHLHTEYSTLDGINRIEELPSHIKTIGQTHVAMTDHGNMTGCLQFVKACRENQVAPIVGIEAYYTANDKTLRERDELNEQYYHIILLAQNEQGLRNLFKISSDSYTEGFYQKPRCDDQLLAAHSEGLIATTACLGSRISQLLLNHRRKDAELLIDHHQAIFKDKLLIELQLHQNPEQELVNELLIEIARTKNLPLVITNDAHYMHEHDKPLHQCALCIQTNSSLLAASKFVVDYNTRDHHVASEAWMTERVLAQNIPIEAIHNTQVIADMIDHQSYFSDHTNHWPRYPLTPKESNPWDYLEKLAFEGLKKRYDDPGPEYTERLNLELKTLKQMGFSDYMLIIRHIVLEARKTMLTGPGRGSASGSLVAYCTGITEIDPIKYDLSFQRFLNFGRSATPLVFTDQMRALL